MFSLVTAICMGSLVYSEIEDRRHGLMVILPFFDRSPSYDAGTKPHMSASHRLESYTGHCSLLMPWSYRECAISCASELTILQNHRNLKFNNFNGLSYFFTKHEDLKCHMTVFFSFFSYHKEFSSWKEASAVGDVWVGEF